MALLERLNPFAGLERPKEVWAWGMYDLANQSFQLIINTLLFGIFIKEVVAADPEQGERFWSRIVAGSLLVVVVLSPLVGAVVDARAWKRPFLIVTGVMGGVLTCLLALIAPGQLWMAALIYVPAAIVIGLGENVLGAFLPKLASKENMGRVSAIGWTMSYVGAIVLQLIVVIATIVMGLKAPGQWRPLFVFAGVWFLLGIIPMVVWLRERPAPVRASGSLAPGGPGISGGLLISGFRRLGATIRGAGRYRQLFRFLCVFFVYSLGTQTVVYFSTIIAKDLKFSTNELFILVLVLSITAGMAAATLVKVQDRLGGLRTVSIFLIVFLVTTLGMAVGTLVGAGKPVFWVLALGIGVGLGGLGTSSRAVVGLFTPEAKSAEFFGLWGMVYKLAGVVGPVAFAESSVLMGRTPALFLLSGFFVVGLVVLQGVDERAGLAEAREG